ncbi:MAG: patatin-like phospholipase family protein [Phaeodactylibacter sp.]|nr:patatin-like phospholipase family protein [Phaeodactylibacter sp.]MCB9274262.1 patatin-like phospholipase family protein [Lewinellaceae bacterium]
MIKEKKKVFKIGIAMAGAVSAGAYTAGVMDYLLETLSKWENAKEKNRQVGKDHPEYDPSVPDHDVIIEVVGGASAGGMTAAIMALSLFEGIRPINKDNPNKENNKLYDSWVGLNDKEDGKPTLLQMLETEDIFDENGVISLLNSKPIDAIAEKAMNLSRVVHTLPDYISPGLEIILTITSLRGIPLAINFFEETKRSMDEPPKPAHKMNLYKGIAHFRVTRDDTPTPPHILAFNPESGQARRALLDCAIATGAFPIGLAPRHLKNTSTEYIKAMVHHMFVKPGNKVDEYERAIASQSLRIEVEDDDFNFFAVDGGTVNNEPFGEVIRALEEKCEYDEERNYAILMIDPFPNFESQIDKDRESTPKVIELAPQILSAIRGQAMVKESDLAEGLSEGHTLRMIFPSRREGDFKDPYPICCGSLDGFGGFFAREFREHDFELGRKNCQSFLRNYFTIPLGRAQSMSVFEGWDANEPRHRRFYSQETNGYPIIPDMTYDPEKYGDNAMGYPHKQRISPQMLFGLEKDIYNRLREVFVNIYKYEKPEMSREARELDRQVEWILKEHYKPSTWSQLRSDLATYIGKLLWKYMGASKVAGIATRTVIKTILMDFKKRGLLDEGQK